MAGKKKSKEDVVEPRFLGAEDADNPMLEATESNKEYAERMRKEDASTEEVAGKILDRFPELIEGKPVPKQADIAGPEDNISSEIIKWEVKLQLDDVRAHELGLDMAQRLKCIGEIERHMAGVRTDCKKEIGGHEEVIKRASKILTDGIESKEMDCQMVRNFTRGLCYVVRVDTRELVETIPMEGDAAQMEIPEVEEEAKVDGRERRITGIVKGYCGKCKRNLADYDDEVFGTLCSDCKEQIWDDEDAANAHAREYPSKTESAGQ